jgi:hypothetical protein
MSEPLFLRVDIGSNGAIAGVARSGILLRTFDMPCLPDGPAGRRAISPAVFAEIIARSHASNVYIEPVRAAGRPCGRRLRARARRGSRGGRAGGPQRVIAAELETQCRPSSGRGRDPRRGEVGSDPPMSERRRHSLPASNTTGATRRH